MYRFYNLALRLTSFLVGLIARFNPKLRLFVSGRKTTFSQLETALRGATHVLWVHTASLGEFEQGLPVIRRLKEAYPEYRILVTFFSPSGYEVRKNSPYADVVTYLPWDTRTNVNRFLDLVSPALAVFVKYEVWPNYYREIEKRGIPLLLVSAIFKKRQVYFKWYGGFMRRSLLRVSHFFVQDQNSAELLGSIGINKVIVSGDTRFDRVWEIRQRDNSLAFMEHFKKDSLCLVAGSTWPEDEAYIVSHINRNSGPLKLKYVLAPHDIKEEHLVLLKKSIDKKVVRYTELATADVENAEVLLIDTMGLLTSIYSYADIAYVGGGFATGLHNTLEPAVYGIPVITGPNYHGFREAVALSELKGLIAVHDQQTFETAVLALATDKQYRLSTGRICASYVERHQGATDRIMQYVRNLLRPPSI